MSILVNPAGRIVNLERQGAVEEAIAMGFKVATPEQVEEFFKTRNFINTTPDKDVFFVTSRGRSDGYGMSSQNLERGMRENDVRLSYTYFGQKVGLVYTYPDSVDALQTEYKFIYTMFESTKIPETWIPYLKRAEKVFVPSKFCQDAFATRDIETTVIPLGYDEKSFFVEEVERKDDTFTFLHYDAFNTRKGWDILFKAFNEEFKKEEKVKLILKTIKSELPFPILRSQYPNIEVIKESFSPENLRKLIISSDCFVFPSRGEGFGLTPLEAVACGVPAIIPNASGMSEYFDDKYFIDVKYDAIPCMYARKEFNQSNCGNMIQVDVADLRKKLRYAFEHRAELKEMGKNGAIWAKENYTIVHTAKKLKAELFKDVKEDSTKKVASRTNVKPTLSIVMLTYNALAYTKKALSSIEANTKSNYELIIIDNLSTDETRDYLKEYVKTRPHIKLILNTENKGVAGGRNQGIALAKGSYITFLDNDVEVSKDWDITILETFRESNVGVVGYNGCNIKTLIPCTFENAFINEKGFGEVDVVAGFCFTFRAELVDLVGNQWTKLPISRFWHEDLDFCLRVKKAGYRIVTNQNIKVKHYQHKSMGDDVKDVDKPENMLGFNENAIAISKRLADSNTLYIRRDFTKEKVSSYDVVINNLVDNLRELGLVVIRKSSITTLPKSFDLCKGTDFFFEGLRYIWLHQENDRPPEDWRHAIASVDKIFMGSRHLLEACKNEPYLDKIVEVCPSGIDETVFNLNAKDNEALRRRCKPNDEFMFLNVGASQPRKNTQNMIKIFAETFKGNKDVVLVLKDGGGYGDVHGTAQFIQQYQGGDYPRIVQISDNLSPEDLASLYKLADSYYHPHKAECFGLPHLEAIACGVKTLGTTNFGGPKYNLANLKNVYFFNYDLEPSSFHNHAKEPYYKTTEAPLWAEPKESEVKSYLLDVYSKRNDITLQEIANESSRAITARFSYKKTASNIYNYFKSLLCKELR